MSLGGDASSGVPTQVAAYASRPRLRTWEGEMRLALLGSIFARIRPRLGRNTSPVSPGSQCYARRRLEAPDSVQAERLETDGHCFTAGLVVG
jgi:hypothetical protein